MLDELKLSRRRLVAGLGWAERLIAAGLMASPGMAAINAAKADGSWTRIDEVEALRIPEDLTAALRGCSEAKAHFDNFPRSSKRPILVWIATSKRPQTRARRIAEAAGLPNEMSARIIRPERRDSRGVGPPLDLLG